MKTYDFYDSEKARKVENYGLKRRSRGVNLVDGKPFVEMVPTGKKPISKWPDRVLVATNLDNSHVTFNGMRQGAQSE